MTTPRVELSYETIGEGRPLVALHGSPGDRHQSQFELERQFAHRGGWRRVYVDLPGHGESPAPDGMVDGGQVAEATASFLRRLMGAEPFALAGTSYGGYLALRMLPFLGEAIDGLLLSVPVIVFPSGLRQLPPRTVLKRDDDLAALARRNGVDWLDEFGVVQSKSALEYILACATARSDGTWQERGAELTPYRISFDRDALPFPAPTLFLLGRQDSICGYRDAWSLIEHFPRATFAVLDGVGHFLWGERTELASVLFQDWLDRVEAWRPPPDASTAPGPVRASLG